jgi:very-short-patch-repair endonuclease
MFLWRRVSLARKTSDPDVMLRLSRDIDPGVQEALASNPNATPEIFDAILHKAYPIALSALARNPRCPESVMETLAVRYADLLGIALGLADNPNTSAAVLAKGYRKALFGDHPMSALYLKRHANWDPDLLPARNVGFKISTAPAESPPSSNDSLPCAAEPDTRPSPPRPNTDPAPNPVLTESPPEEAFWRAYLGLHPTNLDGLVPQYSVGRYRLDFAVPDLDVGIEIDGFAYHATPSAFEKDRKRQRELEHAGWRIVRFSAREVLRDPKACVHEAARWVGLLDRH